MVLLYGAYTCTVRARKNMLRRLRDSIAWIFAGRIPVANHQGPRVCTDPTTYPGVWET
ncbi:hypothetical protein J6590_057105 [Homalodisca vitripennis]|nr:hypothetical protein J6590_057105 [Homalodisca vitripennis]